MKDQRVDWSAAFAAMEEGVPDVTLLDSARLVSSPILGLLMAYSLAFRERLGVHKKAEEEMWRSFYIPCRAHGQHLEY